MTLSVNTRRAHKWRTVGDVTQILTWVNNERAMILLATHREGAPWYILPEPVAHELVDDDGLKARAIKAASVIGLDGSAAAVVKVGRMIDEWLDDLVVMPSAPPPQMSKATYGERILRADGKEIAGEEIRLPVADGAVYG